MLLKSSSLGSAAVFDDEVLNAVHINEILKLPFDENYRGDSGEGTIVVTDRDPR